MCLLAIGCWGGWPSTGFLIAVCVFFLCKHTACVCSPVNWPQTISDNTQTTQESTQPKTQKQTCSDIAKVLKIQRKKVGYFHRICCPNRYLPRAISNHIPQTVALTLYVGQSTNFLGFRSNFMKYLVLSQ